MSTDTKKKIYPLEFAQIAAAADRASFAWGVADSDYRSEKKRGGRHVDELRRVRDARKDHALALNAVVVTYHEAKAANEILERLIREMTDGDSGFSESALDAVSEYAGKHIDARAICEQLVKP